MKLRWLLRYWSRLTTAAFLAILLHAGIAAATDNHPSNEKTLLRIGYLPVLSQLPLIVTYDRERFSYQKVRVELTGFKSYIGLEAAFRVKAIDVAYLPIPTVIAMKADGINVLIGNSLHRGGSSLVIDSHAKENHGSATVYGIPGLMSSELLVLRDSLGHAGLIYGDDYKVAAVELDSAIHALEQGHIDGLFLPEPYPTMTLEQLPEKVRLMQIAAGEIEKPESVLVLSPSVVASSNKAGLVEWLASVERACRFLEEDIQGFGGAQTVLTQQQYFGFEPPLIRQAFSNLHSSLSFSSKIVPMPTLEEVAGKMLSLKLLKKSVNVNQMALDPYLHQ